MFMFLSLQICSMGETMFTDTDPLWHIAAGDLIRATRHIPATDPWSFTAGDYRWLNISWAWDTAMSALRQHTGWHGPMAVNAMTIAGTITLIFVTCLTRCQRFMPAALATCGAVTLFAYSLRPLQVSNLLAALSLLLLGSILRKDISPRFLCLFPLIGLLWVNTHGGFILLPLLLGAFTLQALVKRQHRLATQLGLTLLVTLATLLCNPYGSDIIEAARRPLATVANRFIGEWQPFTPTIGNTLSFADLFLFLLLFFTTGLPLLPVERALALLWCILSFTANRYSNIFAIMGAPIIACALAHWFNRWHWTFWSKGPEIISAYNNPRWAKTYLAVNLLFVVFLPTTLASALFHDQTTMPKSMPEEVAFMQSHPDIRFLTHFNLASIVTFETAGSVPVFVDPRTETAFPAAIMVDYLLFQKGFPGWQNMLEKHGITGVVLPVLEKKPEPGLLRLLWNRYLAPHMPFQLPAPIEASSPEAAENAAIVDRFESMPGWYIAFTGPTAIIFLRR